MTMLERALLSACLLLTSCSGGEARGPIDADVLKAVVEMGKNTHGVDNPSEAEWEGIVAALCADDVDARDLPELVTEIGFVAPSMTTEAAVSAVRPIWALACRDKLEAGISGASGARSGLIDQHKRFARSTSDR